jgi:tRNA nucleotidyltransferase/poly(A) polymerase
MPDYIYLLENRLSIVQQSALRTVRDLAREAQMTVFLTGDSVRDLTCGNPVRDLEVVVHGNALDLKSALTAQSQIWGEDSASRTLYLCFKGNVRLDLRSAKRTEFAKPGVPTYHWASIQEDLRSRDFTVNAMAISLNEGSYGLLMDPTNGVADIEARLLRLVSNYGFLENPGIMVRATRLKARLSFELEERTQIRYENAKGDEMIQYLPPLERSRELEQIGHEDEPLKVMLALEEEGWMSHLFAPWTAAKADVEKLKALHDFSVELQVQGVHPEISAPQMQLLTAKLAAKELAELKKLLLRPGFVEDWSLLDVHAQDFSKLLLSKEFSTPSACYNLFMSYSAEAVLWLGFTTKQAAVREKYENFLKVWPQFRQKIPYALMLEMRITPELPGYEDLVKTIFLQLIDGGLSTIEEIRALLEPHSPPAPPPPVTIKRTRAKKGADAKSKSRLSDEDEEDEDSDLAGEDDEDDGEEDDLDSLDLGSDELDLSLGLEGSRPPRITANGDDEDVFAHDAVGEDDDLDEDVDSEADDLDGEEARNDDRPISKQPGSRKRGSGGRPSLRSESLDDESTATGAGLKALAYKLDLEEPNDPADLDEADPIVDLDDGVEILDADDLDDFDDDSDGLAYEDQDSKPRSRAPKTAAKKLAKPSGKSAKVRSSAPVKKPAAAKSAPVQESKGKASTRVSKNGVKPIKKK